MRPVLFSINNNGMLSFKALFGRSRATAQEQREYEARIQIQAGVHPIDVWCNARGIERDSSLAKEYKAAYESRDPKLLAYTCQGLDVIPSQFLKKHNQADPLPAYFMNTSIALRELDSIKGRKNGPLIHSFSEERQKRDILGNDAVDAVDIHGQTNAEYLAEVLELYKAKQPIESRRAFISVESVHVYLKEAIAFHQQYRPWERRIFFAAKQHESIDKFAGKPNKKYEEAQKKREEAQIKRNAQTKQETERRKRTFESYLNAYANCHYEEWTLRRERAPVVSVKSFMARFSGTQPPQSEIPAKKPRFQ